MISHRLRDKYDKAIIEAKQTVDDLNITFHNTQHAKNQKKVVIPFRVH